MSQAAIIKFAPIYTAERCGNPKWERPGRDFYWPGSLELLPVGETPLLVNHDESRPVGVVRSLARYEETDGPWICAHVTVTDRPSWLSRNTAASFGRITVHAPPIGEDAYRVASAIVKEVSLLSPDRRPREPLARVLWIGESEDSSAGSSSDRSAGEIIYGDGTLIRRFYPNAILAVGGRPVRTSSGRARRAGREVIVEREDGSAVIYCDTDEARRDGVVVL